MAVVQNSVGFEFSGKRPLSEFCCVKISIPKQEVIHIAHDATAADADVARARGDGPDQRLGAAAREHRRAVVLGYPVAGVAELVGEHRQVERVAQRVGAGHPLGDGRLVEDAEGRHGSFERSGAA